MSTKTVVVGMSGGVDSSVAAYLLKQKGYSVIGMFMKNWDNSDVTLDNQCTWVEDKNCALLAAEQLQIPFYSVDLTEEYRRRIVDYMFEEYKVGRTPNPDVLCNREIKFDVFYQKAKELGAELVATGHYCRKKALKKGVYRLLAGRDIQKDQSYFLCQLNQQQLKNSLFPLGDLTKSEVRKIAHELNLNNANKKDSQGLCFIGKVKLPVFLQQALKSRSGDVVLIPNEHPIYNEAALSMQSRCRKKSYQSQDGEVIGKHEGAYYYTVGQRKGLGIGGYAEPLFVIDTDTEKNIIYVGEGNAHKGNFRQGLFIAADFLHWLRPDRCLEIGQGKVFDVRIRYRQPLEKATLFCEKEGIYIWFEKPQRAIAAGQFAAWYSKDELLGSGVIA